MSTQKPFSLLDLTERQRSILLRTTGLDTEDYTWRNAFICVRASVDDMAACGLWHAELMTRKPYPLQSNCWLYQVTTPGMDLAQQLGKKRSGQSRIASSYSMAKARSAAALPGVSKLWEVPRRG